MMMKPLHIDFLPPRPVRVWMVAACGALLLAALSLAGWAGWTYREGRQLQQRIAEEVHRKDVAEKAANQSVSAPAKAPTPPYDADAKRALKESAFATSQALTALEQVTVQGVNPVSVELQAESGLARVEVEFTDQAVLLKYLAALNAGEETPRWQLLRATAKTANQAMGNAVLESKWW